MVDTSINHCVCSPSQILIVPAFDGAIRDTTVCSDAQINLGYQPVNGYTYIWTPVTGLNNATISDPVVTTSDLAGLGDSITYKVTTNRLGCISTDSVKVKVGSALPAITLSAINPVCFGGTGTLSVQTGGGTPGYTYHWSGSGATGQTVSGLPAGIYTLTVTDNNVCSITALDSIVAPTAISAAVTVVNPACFEETGNASVSPAGGSSGYTFLWSAAGATTQTVSNLYAGNYTVTVTDKSGCETSFAVVVTQPSKLILAATGLGTKCFGSCDGQAVVVPSGGTAPLSILWSSGNTSDLSVSGLCTGNISVTITDGKGCQHDTTIFIPQPSAIAEALGSIAADCYQSNGSVSVTAVNGGTGAYTYEWSNGSKSPTAINISPGIYTLTVFDQNGCTGTNSVTVSNMPGVSASILNTTPIACFGNCTGTATARANGGTGPFLYSWDNGNNTFTSTALCQGNYTVTITDAQNCTSTADVLITQPSALTLPAISPVVVCKGQTTNLTADPAGGTPAYTVNWNPGNLTGLTVLVDSMTIGTYTVSVIDANGCNSPTQTITINATPAVGFIAIDTIGCPVLCVNFNDKSVVTGNTITNWLWTFSNGTTSNSQNPEVCFNTGVYSAKLQVSSEAGCESADSIQNRITVWSNPKAAFTINPDSYSTILDPVFNYTDQSSAGVTRWFWNFGDTPDNAKEDTVQNPVHTYAREGTFCTLLTVENDHQCMDTVTHCIEVVPVFTFYVPNTFTPNGDKLNDTFNGKGVGIINYKMEIYDRWGNLIFTTQSLNIGWDGRANGGSQIAQQDVYVYKIVLTDVFNKLHNYIGEVTLLK
jgi:gliding motility-associated-like protein